MGVPGTVDGMVKAHARFGSMPWADLVAPAIALAREGYALSCSQASSLNYAGSAFAPFEASRKYFWAPCKKPSVPTNSAKATNPTKAANSSTSEQEYHARANDPGEEAAIMSDKDPEKFSDQPCRAFEEENIFSKPIWRKP